MESKTINILSFEDLFLGLGCDLNGWGCYTHEGKEEIKSTSKAMLGHLIDTDIDRTRLHLMVEAPDKTQNLSIHLLNIIWEMGDYKHYGIPAMMEEDLERLHIIFTASGFEDVETEVGKMTIGDQEYDCITGRYKYNGQQFYFRQVWFIRDIFLVMVTATSLETDTTEEIFKRVYHLKEDGE